MHASTAVIEDTKRVAQDKSLLSPRFYLTDFKKMNALKIDHMQAEFVAMHKRFKDDPNKNFFYRDDDSDFDSDFSQLPPEFKEFLIRSCVGEFSGALLYKEIAEKVDDPILSETYRLMARDEGRHSGFLRLAMRDIKADLDLQMMQGEKDYVYMHPKLIFYTTYLSEVIGYFRYINIYQHLEENPEKRYHPIFKYFGGWCQDELKHGDFIGLQLDAQRAKYVDGFINRWLIRFFALAVYVTMWLRDTKHESFYASLGINRRDYDMKVIRETNAYAQRAYRLRLDVENPKFFRLLDRMAERTTALDTMGTGVGAKLKSLPLQIANGLDYLRLLLIPAKYSDAPELKFYPVHPVVKGM